jgi:hypothetical protein
MLVDGLAESVQEPVERAAMRVCSNQSHRLSNGRIHGSDSL